MMFIGYANYMMLGVLVMCVRYTSILVTEGGSFRMNTREHSQANESKLYGIFKSSLFWICFIMYIFRKEWNFLRLH